MKKAKNTIKKRILFSQISIIVASLLVTAIVFNLALGLYIRSQTRKQLVTASTVIHKVIASDLSTLNLTGNIKKDDKEASKALLKISRTLKQTQFFLDINYAIIGKDKSLIYPTDNAKEDSHLLQEEILPAVSKLNLAPSEIGSNRIVYFTVAGKKYASLFYPLKIESNKNLGYLFLYSDLTNSRRFITIINIILLSILVFTAVIGFVVSNIVSKKISKPISELNNYAKQIGDRNYISSEINYEDEEIEQLASTMAIMADKIFTYDNTIKTFLQNASHELRTPLMSIQGYAEGIKYGVVENEASAVDIIIDESKRLSCLVEDLLYLSKLDSFQDTINLEKINGENLIRSCIERVSGIAINNGKVIDFTDTNNSITLSADEEKLSRAIINILGNSLRYANHKIEVILREANEKIVIEISDDGPGFDEQDLDKIFERFYKGKGGKYGLGLAITKTIIEKHNGVIIAENNVKGGAIFRIIL